jgi:hypothetical protein
VIGVCGYGRYDDEPWYVGCPRAQSDMTPCIARDGHLALADDLRCVGCNQGPIALLKELADAGVDTGPRLTALRPSRAAAAETLRDVVRRETERLVP